MNKNQVRLAWWGVILLSIVVFIIGFAIMNLSVEQGTLGMGGALGGFIAFGIPIVLIFGLAYIRSGQKKAASQDQKTTG